MEKTLKDVVVVAYGRTGIAKAKKGGLCFTHPVDFTGQLLAAVLKKIPELDPSTIDDVIIGCARPQEVQGSNMARLVALRAGLDPCVPAQTLTRLCSSGLQAISSAANAIMVGQADVVVAGGVEFLTSVSLGTPEEYRCKELEDLNDNAYITMGMTAENVAAKYNVSREEMEDLAVVSHSRAAKAQAEGVFADEIIPVMAKQEDGSFKVFQVDEGIRYDCSPEGLAKLKPCFKADGLVTAGTSSQLSDGAAMTVLMSLDKARELGLTPIARYVGYAVTGVDPAYMGIGPITAVPKVMARTGLTIQDMDVIELNEAFMAQAIPCIKELGLDLAKVNPNGGAVALGHPLGATAVILTCKILNQLRRTGGRYGLVTMCVGGGMGAAGIFEMM